MFKAGIPLFLIIYTFQSLLSIGIKSLTPIMMVESYSNVSPALANMLNIILLIASVSTYFSYISKFFERYGYGGTLAGIFNCMASIGIVLANCVFARLADVFGWGFATMGWLIIGVVSLVLGLISIPIWKRFEKIEGDEASLA